MKLFPPLPARKHDPGEDGNAGRPWSPGARHVGQRDRGTEGTSLPRGDTGVTAGDGDGDSQGSYTWKPERRAATSEVLYSTALMPYAYKYRCMHIFINIYLSPVSAGTVSRCLIGTQMEFEASTTSACWKTH